MSSVSFGVQAADCENVSSVNKVADGIFVRAGKHGIPFQDDNFANIGFVVGDKCVAVIDTGTSVAEGEALKCAIKATTDVPICYLVLTHHHFDHVMGNRAFKNPAEPNDIEIIAHEKLASALQQSAEHYRTQLSKNPNERLPADHIVMPDHAVIVGEDLTIDLGGRSLQIHAHPPAHTNNDLSVIDLKTAAVWLSDLLFVEHVPTIDNSLGSINGWIQEINELKLLNNTSQTNLQTATPVTLAIPGHGPVSVSWPQAANDQQRYLSTLRDEIRKVIANNGTIQNAQDTVGQTEAEQWQMFDFHHRRTIIRAFTDLVWE